MAIEIAGTRAKATSLFERPKALEDASRRLGILAEMSLRAPRPSRREEALREWEAWKGGSGDMPRRVLLRTLCWEPEVVSDERFIPCLRTLRPLNGRVIQALLPTYLRLWRQGGDPEPHLARALREDLAGLVGARGVVERWREFSEHLLGPNAAEAFADHGLTQKVSVGNRLEEMNLATDTEFARFAAAHLMDRATRGPAATQNLDWLLQELLPRDSLIAGEIGWGNALRNLILNQELTADERVRERILDFPLRDLQLPDPRVNSVPWHPVGEEATSQVIRWRSSEDLRFFFDLVMKGKPDHQGRHRFWQKYVDGVTRSLIVLNRNDERRLRRRLSDLEARGRRFARIVGTDLTSAFVMEFGQTIIVEFSEAGNACFVYKRAKGKDLISWHASTVDLRVLKNPRSASSRLIHGYRWEHEFATNLARRGIRAVSVKKQKL